MGVLVQNSLQGAIAHAERQTMFLFLQTIGTEWVLRDDARRVFYEASAAKGVVAAFCVGSSWDEFLMENVFWYNVILRGEAVRLTSIGEGVLTRIQKEPGMPS